jgi:hypothetical protein
MLVVVSSSHYDHAVCDRRKRRVTFFCCQFPWNFLRHHCQPAPTDQVEQIAMKQAGRDVGFMVKSLRLINRACSNPFFCIIPLEPIILLMEPKK